VPKINMIINIWLTFPFVDMAWLDSDGKYQILSCGVHLRVNIPKRNIYDESIIKSNTFF